MSGTNKGTIRDGLVGAIVGDFMGVPVEFKTRHYLERHPVTGPIGPGTHNQPVGTWSDDSSLLLATVASLARNRLSVNYGDIMDSFAAWFFDGEYTPHGHVFDFGNTTAAALTHYQRGVEAERCGGSGLRDNGNGSLMRILPLAYTTCSDREIYGVSSLTHAHEISKIGCLLYVEVCRALLALVQHEGHPVLTAEGQGGTTEGNDDGDRPAGWPRQSKLDHDRARHCVRQTINDVLQRLKKNRDPDIQDAVGHYERSVDIDSLPSDEIHSTGYVVDSFEAAIWSFLTTDSFAECILRAVNLGDDTDTIASIAGGLAGIWYGISAIPEEWLAVCARLDHIESLCQIFDQSGTPKTSYLYSLL